MRNRSPSQTCLPCALRARAVPVCGDGANGNGNLQKSGGRLVPSSISRMLRCRMHRRQSAGGHRAAMANSPAASLTAPPEFIARFELREEIERDSTALDVIGLLRVRVWADEEGELDLSSLPNPDSWLDSFDALPRDACRHWTIRERNAPSEPVAAARLTFHATLDDESARDLKLWRDVGRTLLLPCVDLGRLVVRQSHRRLGLAQVSCRAIAFAICRPSSCRLSSCNFMWIMWYFVCHPRNRS